MNEANKDDQGKQPWHLLPWDAVDEVVKVMQYGAEKYDARNWEHGTRWSRYFSAAIRHLWKWWHGEDTDLESGLHHLAHASCCVLYLLAYTKRTIGCNDRPHQIRSYYTEPVPQDPNDLCAHYCINDLLCPERKKNSKENE